MKIGILLLTVLAVFTVPPAVIAWRRPMLKNILRFAMVPLAFLLCLLMHALGLFSMISDATAEFVIGLTGGADNMMQISADGSALAAASVSMLLSSVLFVNFFWILLVLLRLILVPILYRLISRKTAAAVPKTGETSAVPATAETTVQNGQQPAEASSESLSAEQQEPAPAPVQPPVQQEADGKEKVMLFVRPAVSTLCAILGGLFISAVLLMPMFHIMQLGSSFSAAYDSEVGDGSKLNVLVRAVDEDVISGYEESFALGVYRGFGLHQLMCAVADTDGEVMLVSGEKANAWHSLCTLAEHGIHAAVLLECTEGSDAAISADLRAISADPVLVGILADYLIEATDNLQKGQDGELGNEIMSALSDSYTSARRDVVIADLRCIFGGMEKAAETSFLNDLARNSSKPETALVKLMEDEETLRKMLDEVKTLSVYTQISEVLFDHELDLMCRSLELPEERITQILAASDFTDWATEDRVPDTMRVLSVAKAGDAYLATNQSGNSKQQFLSMLGLAGVCLDQLHDASCTQEVPRQVMYALMETEWFADLLNADDLENWLDAADRGETTYFSMMESLRVLIELQGSRK